MDKFDPSRIPPRIAFTSARARGAVINEIGDLTKPNGEEPPAMVEVSLIDMLYRNVPRAHSALVIKRERVGIYKVRLRIRGDTVPIAQTAFISLPAANRFGIKSIFLIAPQTRWAVHASDVSHAFLQAVNSNHDGRAILIPPPTAQLPWGGPIHPPETDLGEIQSPGRGPPPPPDHCTEVETLP